MLHNSIHSELQLVTDHLAAIVSTLYLAILIYGFYLLNLTGLEVIYRLHYLQTMSIASELWSTDHLHIVTDYCVATISQGMYLYL